jgi:hypothetical protein
MTISSTTRKTALFAGNGSTTSFAFTFKVQDSDDVVVYMLEDDVETAVTTGFTVTLNANQNTNPGGSILFDTAPTADQDFIITTDADPTQEQDIQNQSAFSPAIVMEALDKLTILAQQLAGKVGRALKLRITDTSDNDDLVPETGKALGWGVGGWTWISDLATTTVSSFMETPLLTTSAHAFCKAVGIDMTVKTKALLKALTSPSADIEYNVQYSAASGDGWGGAFEWLSTNQSSNVTADPAEAIYVAPNSDATGASGAWRRKRDGNYAKAIYFGIRGDAGTTSNTPTMFQRMEDTCDSLNIKEIRYEERNYYWSDTIVVRRNFMRHRGMGATQTLFTFNHTNNGIQYGDDTLFCYRPTIEDIGYVQASGSAYAHYFYHGREPTIKGFVAASDVRNFAKAGAAGVPVTNITNNGSGLIRVTVGSAQTWQTGMKIAIAQVAGDATLVAALAAVQFNITRVSSTEFDLQSSTFAGAYTTGGMIGPFTSALTFVDDTIADALKIRDKYFVDVYSLGGNLFFNGMVIVENPARTAGSVGVYFRKDTSCWERMDYMEVSGTLSIRRFKKGIYKDNCRVVSVRGTEILLDECETSFEIIDDDAAAKTKGTEEIVIGKLRIGYDPTVTSAKSMRLKATESSITEVSIGQFNGTGTDTIIELIGGSTGYGGNGIYHFRMGDTLLEMRPAAATTKDGVTIEGYVEFTFDTIIARAQGNGTERDAIRIADSWVGSGQVGRVQMTGLSGYGVTVGASVVAATASLYVRDIQNITTAANRISDSANIARVDPGPPRRGSATYDPANLVDGAGATTTVTVTGAALGDIAQASFSLDLQGITLTAWVSAANTVSVRFQNETGGAIDLASGTLTATAQPVT